MRPYRVTRAPLAVAMGAMFVLLTGCGAAPDSQAGSEGELLQAMRARYERHFGRDRPDRVVITYPETPAALPELKRAEFGLLSDVLRKRGISFETRPLSEALTKVVAGKREYTAFVVPETVDPGSTVLYLNLEADDLPSVVNHPDAKARGVTVRVWNDPLRVSTVRGA